MREFHAWREVRSRKIHARHHGTMRRCVFGLDGSTRFSADPWSLWPEPLVRRSGFTDFRPILGYN